ncbi:MAG: helix-turn-helix domain-containing protein [Acidobacteriota bacterium]|nr:helix-turn-helix domain-containing protein [Acidobacteriota bacterium]
MQSVKSRTKKTTPITATPELSPITYDQVEVASAPSNSRLGDLYKTEEFATEWANNIPFHVARNILHLRRHRGWSQLKLATAMGTSQSAIARMENGHENITLDTLQRLVSALDGRFHIWIAPKEFSVRQNRPWWELLHEKPWRLTSWVSLRGTESDQVIVGLERPRGTFVSNVAQLLPQTTNVSERI